jgi:hypothetical protein
MSNEARPASRARQEAGFSIAEAARRAAVSEGYLRRVERLGAPYLLARRLAGLYRCPVELFLPAKPPLKGGQSRAKKREWM